MEENGLQKPVIYCSPDNGVLSCAVPLNIPLAQKLVTIKPSRRSMRLEGCLREILNASPENAIICDFDVLFHPSYQVDVLTVLVTACRRRPFSVVWPGRYSDGRLYYAEEGFPDYAVFDVSDYDVTCVV